MKQRLAATVVFAAIAAAIGASQAPERTLAVDFYALGGDGSPVADLRPEEVTVKVDGRARAVRSLRLVRQAAPPAADPLAPAMAPPEPFATNRAGEGGRSFILVVEDESFRPGKERPIRSAVRAFLGALSPKDHVSLWTVPHGGIKVDLTSNHDRVAAGIDLVNGHGPDQESSSDASCRTRFTLDALDQMLTSLTGGEGPTSILFFTASMYGPSRDAAAKGPPGMCELRTDEFTRVGHSAAQARAHLFIIQPEDLQRRPTSATDTLAGAGFATTMNPLEGMEQLAAVTGASRLSLTRLGDETLVGHRTIDVHVLLRRVRQCRVGQPGAARTRCEDNAIRHSGPCETVSVPVQAWSRAAHAGARGNGAFRRAIPRAAAPAQRIRVPQ